MTVIQISVGTLQMLYVPITNLTMSCLCTCKLCSLSFKLFAVKTCCYHSYLHFQMVHEDLNTTPDHLPPLSPSLSSSPASPSKSSKRSIPISTPPRKIRRKAPRWKRPVISSSEGEMDDEDERNQRKEKTSSMNRVGLPTALSPHHRFFWSTCILYKAVSN